MGKKLELMWDVSKNVPTALYELACALSITGGALALPVAGAIYLSGHPETAKYVAAGGGLGICGGILGGFFRAIPFILDSCASPVDGYQADLLAQHSLAIKRIAGYIGDYRRERKGISK